MGGWRRSARRLRRRKAQKPKRPLRTQSDAGVTEIQIRRADPQDARRHCEGALRILRGVYLVLPYYDGECPPEAVIEVHSEVNVSKAAANERDCLPDPLFSATKFLPDAYLTPGQPGMTFSSRLRPTSVVAVRDLIYDVLRTLWSHKLRAFLTMFGIAWGIVSIVLMVAAGEGLRKGQEDQARNLGKDVMIVFHGRTSLQAGGSHAGRVVHWEDPDVAVVQAESPDCEYAIPELEQDTVRTHSNFNNAAFTVTGSYQQFGYIRSLDVGAGRFYDWDEMREDRRFARPAGKIAFRSDSLLTFSPSLPCAEAANRERTSRIEVLPLPFAPIKTDRFLNSHSTPQSRRKPSTLRCWNPLISNYLSISPQIKKQKPGVLRPGLSYEPAKRPTDTTRGSGNRPPRVRRPAYWPPAAC